MKIFPGSYWRKIKLIICGGMGTVVVAHGDALLVVPMCISVEPFGAVEVLMTTFPTAEGITGISILLSGSTEYHCHTKRHFCHS
jgi:hypothetical protein